MTREEAIAILDTIPTIGEQVDALEMAIEALQHVQCFLDGPCEYQNKDIIIPRCGNCSFYDSTTNVCNYWDADNDANNICTKWTEERKNER